MRFNTDFKILTLIIANLSGRRILCLVQFGLFPSSHNPYPQLSHIPPLSHSSSLFDIFLNNPRWCALPSTISELFLYSLFPYFMENLFIINQFDFQHSLKTPHLDQIRQCCDIVCTCLETGSRWRCLMVIWYINRGQELTIERAGSVTAATAESLQHWSNKDYLYLQYL